MSLKADDEAVRGLHHISLKEVAEASGVSSSTVSRVLSGKHSQMISESTRKRVKETATQLGYSPHPIASALRGKKTQLLGVIVREIDDPFFAHLIATLSTQAANLGYRLVLGHAHSDPRQVLDLTSGLDFRNCDGLIIMGDMRDGHSAIQQIQKANPFLVALCCGQNSGWLRMVNTDNRLGMGLLLDHLIGLGHHQIAFMDGGRLGDIRERREAFDDCVRVNKLPSRPGWFQTETNDPEGGYRAMQRLLALTPRPTAVVVCDDIMAIGALNGAIEAGLRVPDDVSITGFDDIELSRYVSPPLTTVRQPVDEIGSRALFLLTDLIGGKVSEPNMEVVTPELIIRRSTGPAPGRKKPTP